MQGFSTCTTLWPFLKESVKPLTNQDVINLVKSRLAPDVIAAQLLNRGCDCVISAVELERLKAEGVPDRAYLP